ncbi:MAG TPA: EpsI family protein [Gemmatimonadales bacterium]
MPGVKSRQWIPALILVAGCALLLLSARQRTMPLARTLTDLPAEAFGYVGRDLVISPEERAIAGMSSYLLRVYQNPAGAQFSFYVGYYEAQTQGKSIHSPKNCLPGAGWEPIQAGTAAIPVGGAAVRVNRYILGKESSTALVYYWYQGRGRIASDEYLVKWDLLRDKALTGRSDEALVRIVVPYRGNVAAADSLAVKLAAELIPQVESRLPPYPGRAAVKS